MIKRITTLLAVWATLCHAGAEPSSTRVDGTLIIDNNKAVFGDHPKAGISEPLPCIVYIGSESRFRVFCDMSRYVAPDQPISQGIVRVRDEVLTYLNWNGRTIAGVKDRLHEQGTAFLSNTGVPRGALQPAEVVFLGFNATTLSVWRPVLLDYTLFSYSLSDLKNPQVRVDKKADGEKGSAEYVLWAAHPGAATGEFCFGRLTVMSEPATGTVTRFEYEDRIFSEDERPYNSQVRTAYRFNANRRTEESFPQTVLLDRETAKQVIITDLRAAGSKDNVGYYVAPRDPIPFGADAPPLRRAMLLEQQQQQKAMRASVSLVSILALVGFVVFKYQRALKSKQQQ